MVKCKKKGLQKLPGELISKAQDETTATIARTVATLVGIALFCSLALIAPDASLLLGGERLNVPLAGPVSFLGFVLLGPLILMTLRVYLQIYIEHWRRLEPLRTRLVQARAPTLAPLRNPLLRAFAGFVIYLLLPLSLAVFTWKALVLPVSGSALLAVTVGVAVIHLLLPLPWSWRSKTILSATAALVSAGVLYATWVATDGNWIVRRPFDLFRADLSNQYLPDSDLQSADLWGANLQGANLRGADLRSADLQGANLQRADLQRAQLEGAHFWGANLQRARLRGADLGNADLTVANLQSADLRGANLQGAYIAGATFGGANLQGATLQGADFEVADLAGANLQSADLRGADLRKARSLTQAQLNEACGDDRTQLPNGLTIRTCEAEPEDVIR